MAGTAVEFADVSYALRDGRLLLRNISLQLAAATTTAILGRSGSGKTTLLRTVNRLVQPTSGTVLLGGKRAQDYDLITLRRSIGYVIQETGLFPHMTIERNAGLALELAGNGAERENRIAEVLALAGIPFEDFRARYPWQLSGGQRQRVGLARALACDPTVLLMDEPFGALDPLTRAEMQTMLRDLLQRIGKTVLLVTHDLPEALYLAQRLVFLESGQVVADLAQEEVLRSDNAHVRSYVDTLQRTLPERP